MQAPNDVKFRIGGRFELFFDASFFALQALTAILLANYWLVGTARQSLYGASLKAFRLQGFKAFPSRKLLAAL